MVAGSNLQFDEQQSPFTWLPSSQSSPGSITPFPQQAPAIAASTICVMAAFRSIMSVLRMLPSVPSIAAMTCE